MSKIKIFFQTLLDYLLFPYYWITTIGFEKKFRKLVEEDMKSLITERDVEFLRSIGVETTLEELRNGGKKNRK